jgi:hypothetical protein
MIDHGYRKAFISKSNEFLLDILNNKRNDYQLDALIDIENILNERNVEFISPFITESSDSDKTNSSNYKFEGMSTSWITALNLRKDGKSDEEIRQFLEEKKITDNEINLIFLRLPKVGYKNPQFEKLLSKGVDKAQMEFTFSTIIIVAMGLFFIYFSINGNSIIPLILGTLILIIGMYLINKNGSIKSLKYWQGTINYNPEKLVWVKPIVEKHTVYYVLTLYKEKHFQILDNEKNKVKITCDTTEEQQTFIESIKYLFPHVQFGYSRHLQLTYDEQASNYISAIQEKGLYTPVDYYNNPTF